MVLFEVYLMATCFKSTGPHAVAACLLLLAATLADGDSVTWRQCQGSGSRPRTVMAGRDNRATYFNLIDCGIKQLERDAFSDTSLPNLEIIMLNINQIEFIEPSAFDPVSHIRTLDLTKNKLREIPVFKTPFNLNDLHITHNRITAINNPMTFRYIQTKRLYLGNNLIEYIHPEAFQPLVNLTTIYLNRNRMVTVPEKLFQLPSLKSLSLEDNVIHYVSPRAFYGSKINSWDLRGNRLSFLPSKFVSELVAPPSRVWIWIDSNPWHCACLLELLADLTRAGVNYVAWRYDGKWTTCVFPGRYKCHRQVPSELLPTPSVLDISSPNSEKA